MIHSFKKHLSQLVLLTSVALIGLSASTVAVASELSPTEPLVVEAKAVAESSARVDAAGLPRLAFDQDGESEGLRMYPMRL